MEKTKFELMVMQLHLVNKIINNTRFHQFEEFVTLDRYRQDLEFEVKILEGYKVNSGGVN